MISLALLLDLGNTNLDYWLELSEKTCFILHCRLMFYYTQCINMGQNCEIRLLLRWQILLSSQLLGNWYWQWRILGLHAVRCWISKRVIISHFSSFLRLWRRQKANYGMQQKAVEDLCYLQKGHWGHIFISRASPGLVPHEKGPVHLELCCIHSGLWAAVPGRTLLVLVRGRKGRGKLRQGHKKGW